MKGKRESQKRELRERILAASKEVFEENGCRRSTMQEIAQRAHVGLGTAYNYFASKEELFLLSIAEGLFLGSGDAALPDLEGDVVDHVFEYTKRLLIGIERYGKDTWREVVTALFATQPTNGDLFMRMMNADLWMVEGLKRLLLDLQRRGSLPAEVDVDVAAEVAYSSVVSQLVWYFFDGDMTFGDLLEKVRVQMAFVFRDARTQ